MSNDLALKSEEIKNDKDLYTRYGIIINSEITNEVIDQFKTDILVLPI